MFIDTETTGLSPTRERIIEIYLLKLARSGQVMEYGTLINPGKPIPRKITEITGLTDADVADAPTEQAAAPKIREFIGNGIPVSHNLPFDRRFLNAMFRRTHQQELLGVGIDTLAMSRQFFPRLCIYPGGGGSHKLSNLMYHFGLDQDFANSHRAKDDVMLLIEVFRNLQDHAKGRRQVTYPTAVTHGCPTCGSAMRLEVKGSTKMLVCTKKPSCQEELVV